MRLAGKVALISGASRNIGRSVALAFAREGAALALGARSREADLRSVADGCARAGADVLPVLGDLGTRAGATALVERTLERFGRVDVLVSLAAVRPHTPFLELTYEEWREVLAVNLDATFHLCKAAVPGMVARGRGSIIAFGGLAALTGVQDAAATSAAKTGLLGLIRALAVELGPHGVRANMVVPGNVDTARANPEWYRTLPEQTASAANVSRIPLRRLARPDEVAAACLFLASDESSYVTGSQLVCNGGSFIA